MNGCEIPTELQPTLQGALEQGDPPQRLGSGGHPGGRCHLGQGSCLQPGQPLNRADNLESAVGSTDSPCRNQGSSRWHVTVPTGVTS